MDAFVGIYRSRVERSFHFPIIMLARFDDGIFAVSPKRRFLDEFRLLCSKRLCVTDGAQERGPTRRASGFWNRKSFLSSFLSGFLWRHNNSTTTKSGLSPFLFYYMIKKILKTLW